MEERHTQQVIVKTEGRILIERRLDGRYFSASGWTLDRSWAVSFESTCDALKFIRTQKFRGVDLKVSHADSKLDVTIPGP